MQNANHTPVCVSNDISTLIGCWHALPWKLRHFGQSNDTMFLEGKVLKPLQSGYDMCHQSNFTMCRSPTSKLLYRSLTKAFPLESSPKASWNFKNCNIEYEEHSKQNHSNHFPRSQSSLELNSKASRNFKKPQINEVLQVKASKASKNFHHKPSKTKNMKNTKNKEFLTSS